MENFFSNDDLNIAFGLLLDNLLNHFYLKFEHDHDLKRFKLYEDVIITLLNNSEMIWWHRRKLL